MGKTPGGSPPSLEDRLQAARVRAGLVAGADDKTAERDRAAERSALSIGMRAGMELVASLAVAVAIGWALDRWLHTAPWLMVAFMPLGFAAGIRNVWRLVGPPPSGPGNDVSGGPSGPHSGGA